MRIAVTDACIFFDLIDLYLTARFFSLDLEIITTSFVMNEVSTSQRAILNEYISTGKLQVINISFQEEEKIKESPFPRSLSIADKSVLYFAKDLNAIVLSSDRILRNYAAANAVEYYGLLWIIDRLYVNNLISKRETIQKLQEILAKNPYFSNRPDLVSAIENRISELGSS